MTPSDEFASDGCRLVSEIQILGLKAVPWKAPQSKSGIKKSTGAAYRIHYKDKSLTTFQKGVEDCSSRAMENRAAPRGPIHLEITVRRATDDKAKHGHWAYLEKEEAASGFGDLRNVGKAIEDAIQGHCFLRDSQVCSIRDRSFWSARDSILIRVYSIKSNLPEGFSQEEI